VRLLLDFDRILGFDLNGYLQSDLPRRKADSRTYLASVPAEIAALVQERERLRERGEYARADEIRYKLESAGYAVKDTAGVRLCCRVAWTTNSQYFQARLMLQITPRHPISLNFR